MEEREEEEDIDLLPLAVQVRVSSVLNRDHHQFGKQNLVDGNAETCWNSDQGSPQLIQLEFDEDQPVDVHSIGIQFQGGFVGKDCFVVGSTDGSTFDEALRCDFFPRDENHVQNFPLRPAGEPLRGIRKLRIVFESSTDFYGRVTIYQLRLWGRDTSASADAPPAPPH